VSLSPVLAARGIQVSLDPGERYMQPNLAQEVFGMLRDVDVFLPSQQELESLLGSVDPWEAAGRFSDAGPGVVVVKAGSRGSFVYDRRSERRWTIPAYPTRVVDVTGAGDAYCGGFMVGYAEAADPALAACFGTVSASFVLEGFGALRALCFPRANAQRRLGELQARIRQV
jgi:ribokinase